MTVPAREALYARRNVPLLRAFDFASGGAALDMANYSGKLQVRTYPGTGSALLTLNTVTNTDEGIRFNYGLHDILGTDVARTGALRIKILEATLDTLPANPGIHGEDQIFHYDLVITPNGGIEQVWLQGQFILSQGVTE